MEELLLKLSENNIGVKVEKGALKLNIPQGFDAKDLLGEVRIKKEELIAFITARVNPGNGFRVIDKATQKENYELSSAQKRLYFLHEFDNTSLAYNMPLFAVLEGELDLERLNSAFNKLLLRHESLRTSFAVVNEEPVQRIAPHVDFELEYFVAGKAEAEMLIQSFVRPFDLHAAPLLRAGLVRTGEQEHILMVDIHHIITDGVAQGILVRDFMSFYNNETLPELRLQYKDYAEWQNGNAQQERIENQRAFWLNEFAETPTELQLPADFERPLIKRQVGSTTGFELNADETRKLKAIAEAEGATLFMVILSIYNILLARLGNQQDIVIGTPIAGRQHADLEKIIGLFVNTLPVRNYPKGSLRFRDFLANVKAKTLSCFDNQAYQYESLVDELKIERNTSRNPLFEVMFVFQNFEHTEFSIPGLRLRPYDHQHSVSSFDLTLLGSDTGNTIILNFEYATEIFRQETIERFMGYFRNIVAAVIADVNIQLSAIGMLPESEKHLLLSTFNDTKFDYPADKTITQIFEAQVEKTPHNTALVFNDVQLTYAGLNEKANQLAAYLLQSGVGRESIVGLLIDRSPEMIAGIIGILKTGATYLPLDVTQPQQRTEQMLADSGACLLLTKEMVHNAYALSQSRENLNAPASAEDVAYIIYTSGSTGTPKGVMVRHKGVANLIYSRSRAYRMNEAERVLQFSTICFDASVEQIWLALFNGAALVLIARETLLNNDLFNQYIVAHKITHLDTTPSFMESIELDESNSLKRICIGGEECTASLADRFYRKYELYNEYGPTETTVVSIACLVTAQELQKPRITIGKPIGNTSVYILGHDMELLPQGAKGEMYIGGHGVGKGYLNDEALTASRFVKHPFVPGQRMYKTGDVAKWLPDGTIEFLGRSDTQVKIRGFRVEPGEITSRLVMHAQVKTAVVIAKGQENDKYLIAYYVSDKEITAGEFRTFLSDKLPDYMIPAQYVRLEALPLTLNGKVNTRALPLPRMIESKAYTAPANETEMKLVEIWAEVLKLDKSVIDVNRNFFELGGHSLRTVVLVNKIMKELNVAVPVKEVFMNQDIRSLAAFISKTERSQFCPIEKATEKEHYVLSSAQRRLYFLYEFDKTSLAYNMPQVVKLKGELDKARMTSAFNKLIMRHESLRTYFETVDEQVVQKIPAEVNFEFEYFTANEIETAAIIKQFIRPFNLHHAPLVRAGLIEITAQEHVLMIDMHHIITDGVSDSVLVKDFMMLYNNEALPELRLQYKDYAEWQQSHAQQWHIVEQKNFWLNEFSEAPPVLELPLDFQRPAIKNQHGEMVQFELCVEHTAALKAIAEAEGATMFMVVLAIYTILLARLANQQDIIVGSPIAGRQHADLDNMIGMFVNTLSIRNEPAGALRFREFLYQVKAKTLACFDNQAYQYEDLVDELKLVRDTARNPLFDVFFAYENFEEPALEIPGLTLDACNSGFTVAKFDLTLSAHEPQDRLQLNFAYSTALFKRETIERFAVYFKNIVSAIAEDANTTLSAIEMLGSREKQQLLVEFNDTVTNYPRDKNIIALFEAQVNRTPHNTAVLFNDVALTYAELNEKANQLAAYLLKNGVGNQSIVGLMIERSPEMIVGLIGILKAGAAYLPLDATQPQQRTQQMMQDSRACLLLTEKVLRNADILAESTVDQGRAISPDDTAYIIYTSGSTGEPKGVVIQHRSVLNLVNAQQRKFGITEADRILQFSTITFDASVEQIWLALLSGAGLVLVEKEVLADNLQFNRYISRYGVTHLHATPSFLESIELNDQPGLIRIIAGGEECKPQLAMRFCRQYRFYNEYGPTETTVTSIESLVTEKEAQQARIPVGKPIDNTFLYILGNKLELLPAGVKGELYIGGEGLAKGYLHQEALTSQKFVSNPFMPGQRMYRTGDLAFWQADGNLVFAGRIDNQVKIRGFRIELGEIEHQLAAHSDVNEAVVIASEEQGDKYLVAYYVSAKELDAATLRSFLSASLPDYMLPAYYVQLHELPLTATGKLNRRALPQPQMTGSNYVAPSNQTEALLQEIWCEILGKTHDQVSVTASFFELGGHSLKTTLLANRIFKKFNVEVPLKDIFRLQSITGLSKFIGNANISEYSAIEIAPVKQHYRLSSAQKRLYFLYEFEKGSVTYNMSQVVRLEGNVDKERLATAFQQLIARHESLRTAFEVVDEEPVQKILPQVEFEIRHFSASEGQAPHIIREFIQPFDLSKAPLIRAGRIEISPDNHILVVDMHHIITDGVSHGILIRDFTALYNEEAVHELKLQYKDYSEWQQSPAQQEKIASQKNFWLREFSDTPTILNLPTDFPRPLVRDDEGASIEFTFTSEETRSLKQLAEKQGVTMYMLMLALYNILLSRLSNQDDIVVGTPVAGRQHVDVEHMIGMFVNTLPLRNTPSGNLKFTHFLSTLRSKTLACFDNQAYPYEALIDELKLVRDTSRSPLFDTMFAYRNFESAELSMPGLAIKPYETGHAVAKFDLTLDVNEGNDQLFLSFEYAVSLFKEDTIKRFIAYFRKIAAAVIADAGTTIYDIAILGAEETAQLLSVFNNTAMDYPRHKNIIQLFEAQAAITPNNIAVICGREQLTYAAFKERAHKIASYLVNEKNVQPGHLVGLLLEREEYLLPAIFGILKAGAAYIPIDPAYPADRVNAIIEDSGLKLLITRKQYIDPMLNVAEFIDLDKQVQRIENYNQPLPAISFSTDSLAYIIYTSGSTGKPKGVMIAHQSLVNIVECLHKEYPLQQQDRYLLKTTYSFDVSIAEIFGWFPNGGSISLLASGKAGDPEKLMEAIERDGITHINFVPSMFSVFVEALEDGNVARIKSLKYIFLAGEALPADLVKRFLALNTSIRLENIYGPTEATIYSTAYSIAGMANRLNVPIGHPLSNVRLYVVDGNYNLQPIGVPGELCIAGEGLAKGYLNNEVLTAQKFIHIQKLGERVYRTGDLVKWLPDGNIDFLGRIDHQVKIRGFRIELGEIESRLTSHPQISEAAVLVKEKQGDKYLAAYYVSAQSLEVPALKSFLAGKLPEYMIPIYYVHLAEMPLTFSGKLNRKALPDPEANVQNEYVAPCNAIEEGLTAIWADVLKLDKLRISVTGNFFELGGHSLKATRLVFRIQKQFGQEASLLDIFRFPTIREFARKLQQNGIAAVKRSDLLIALKQDPNEDKNFFFIHEGSGDVQGYVEFAGLMKGHNIWGIRSATLRHYVPQNTSVETLATEYVQVLKTVQPQGPYKIAGWSHGGVIAYEITKQLEAAGDTVEILLMIDSRFPVTEFKERQPHEKVFTLEQEKPLIFELLEMTPPVLETAGTMEDLWQRAVSFLDNEGPGLAKIKNMIPHGIRSILPHLDEIAIEDLITYVNTIRTLENSVRSYRVSGLVKARPIYVRAIVTIFNLKLASQYFKSPITVIPAEGNHFSMLQPPYVHDLTRKLNKKLHLK